ncbi:VirS [Lachnospiraceae bacterium TWA4]|nr:VirS [Lachnospiraceae bacterium TWA4]
MFHYVIKMGEIYEKRQQINLIEMKKEMLQKSLDETERAFKLWRNSIHDYKNHVLALTALADEGKIEEIKAYLSKENELIKRKIFYIKTGNSVVDTIINTKQTVAEEKGIEFIINVSIPRDCIVSGLDMANILGNLIDNAIEASEKEEKPYIDLQIMDESRLFIIRISNKYSKELSNNLNTTKIEKGISWNWS